MLRLFAIATLLLLCTGCDVTKTWQLEKSVKEALAKDSRTAQYDFQITADENGTVSIAGEVNNIPDIDIVSAVVKKVAGVKQVMNHCTAPEPGNNGLMDDTVIPSPVGL